MPINTIKNDIIISLPSGNQIPMSVLIGALNQMIDDYYLELGNKVTVVAGYGLSQEDFTTALKDKVDQMVVGYVGFYADEAALNLAYPTAVDGAYATVGSTDTIWSWDSVGVAWVNSGTSSLGDMVKSVYDPTGVEGDAFDMDNMVEGSNTKIFTQTERSQLADVLSWGDHALVGYLEDVSILYGSFQIFKASGNTNLALLETNDLITGIWSPTRFWVSAKYNGGTITNEANYSIYQELTIS